MIADLGEIIRAVYGVGRLFRRDPAALAFFDTSAAGAWRSFTAAALFAPLNFLFAGLLMGRITPAVDPARYWSVELLAYVISWVMFPVIAAMALEQLDRGDRLPALVCVYNWMTLALKVVFVGLNLFILTGVLPTDIGGFGLLIVYGAALYYLWFLIRLTADLPALAAAGLVALDQLLNYGLLVISQRLH